MSAVLRVICAAAVALAIVLAGRLLVGGEAEAGDLRTLGTALVAMFAVSAILPHYLYRGEPLLPRRTRRTPRERDARAGDGTRVGRG